MQRYINGQGCEQWLNMNGNMSEVEAKLIEMGLPVDVFLPKHICSKCAHRAWDACPVLAIPGLLKRGVRYHGDDGDSGVTYWIFSKAISDEEILTYLSTIGVDLEGRHIYSPYDCTGKLFSDPVWLSRHGSRVLVTQDWGYDV